MFCSSCGCKDSKVIDSRSTDEGKIIRRRRECSACGKRFTTYETIETAPILVIKSDGNRQPFDEAKIKSGIIKSCEKRPVSMSAIDKLVDDIKKQISNMLEQEIESKKIGEMVMNGLKELDIIAYIRYASVYLSFENIDSFYDVLNKLKVEKDK